MLWDKKYSWVAYIHNFSYSIQALIEIYSGLSTPISFPQ